MTPDNYIENVLRTETTRYGNARCAGVQPRLLHAIMGMVTEAGEAADMLKKHIFYGKEYDQINLIEEVGDMLWYIAIALDEMNITFEEVMERNIAKLKVRYGDAWTQQRANERDLDKERQELEGNPHLEGTLPKAD